MSLAFEDAQRAAHRAAHELMVYVSHVETWFVGRPTKYTGKCSCQRWSVYNLFVSEIERQHERHIKSASEL